MIRNLHRHLGIPAEVLIQDGRSDAATKAETSALSRESSADNACEAGQATRRVRERDGIDRGQELAEVLALAEQFPARHARKMTYPRFGSR